MLLLGFCLDSICGSGAPAALGIAGAVALREMYRKTPDSDCLAAGGCTVLASFSNWSQYLAQHFVQHSKIIGWAESAPKPASCS